MRLFGYDREGRPITDRFEWARLHDDLAYVHVRATAITDKIDVSTVWLGLDRNFLGNPPLIFETMVFGGELDGHAWRYATLEAAESGHDTVVELARQAVDVQ